MKWRGGEVWFVSKDLERRVLVVVVLMLGEVGKIESDGIGIVGVNGILRSVNRMMVVR